MKMALRMRWDWPASSCYGLFSKPNCLAIQFSWVTSLWLFSSALNWLKVSCGC